MAETPSAPGPEWEGPPALGAPDMEWSGPPPARRRSPLELAVKNAPLFLAFAGGIFLGIRLGQHLGGLRSGKVSETPSPPAAPAGPVTVVHRNCAECDQRTRAAHEANLRALQEQPLTGGNSTPGIPTDVPQRVADLLAGLSPTERAYVEEQLDRARRGIGPDEPLITVGDAPPIGDLP